jgi:hypothetical protein
MTDQPDELEPIDDELAATDADIQRYLDEDAAPPLAVQCVQLEYLRQIRDALQQIAKVVKYRNP